MRKLCEFGGVQELVIPSQALPREGVTTIRKRSTLERGEAHRTKNWS
jgi:hypothetical protein